VDESQSTARGEFLESVDDVPVEGLGPFGSGAAYEELGAGGPLFPHIGEGAVGIAGGAARVYAEVHVGGFLHDRLLCPVLFDVEAPHLGARHLQHGGDSAFGGCLHSRLSGLGREERMSVPVQQPR